MAISWGREFLQSAVDFRMGVVRRGQSLQAASASLRRQVLERATWRDLGEHILQTFGFFELVDVRLL